MNILNENCFENGVPWLGGERLHSTCSISHYLSGRPFSLPVDLLWTYNTSLMDEACYGLDRSLLNSPCYPWWNLFHAHCLGSELNKKHGLEGRIAFISLLHSYRHHAEDVWESYVKAVVGRQGQQGLLCCSCRNLNNIDIIFFKITLICVWTQLNSIFLSVLTT